MRIATIEDLATRLQICRGGSKEHGGTWGGAIFLVGAGCSRSAGIPLAQEIERYCVKLLNAKLNGTELPIGTKIAIPDDDEGKRSSEDASDAALRSLWENGHLKFFDDSEIALRESWESEHQQSADPAIATASPPDSPLWGNLYSLLFATLLISPNEQRKIIQKAISEAGESINWSHLCLGAMMQERFVHTILTTNFDLLALRGAIYNGVVPVVSDSEEGILRISSAPSIPQIVQLHGSMHAYHLFNSREDLNKTRKSSAYRRAISSLIHDSNAFVVVGYSGGEEGIMEIFSEAFLSDKTVPLYWVSRDPEDRLSAGVQRLLKQRANSFLIPIEDSDQFFAELRERLKVGLPLALRRPTVIDIVETPGLSVSQHIKKHQELATAAEKEFLKSMESVGDIEKASRLKLSGKYAEAVDVLKEVAAVSNDGLELLVEAAYELAKKSEGEQRNSSCETIVDASERALKQNATDPVKPAHFLYRQGEAYRMIGKELGAHDRSAKLRAAIEKFQDAIRRLQAIDDPEAGKQLLNAIQEHGDTLIELGEISERPNREEFFRKAAEILSEAKSGGLKRKFPYLCANIDHLLGKAYLKLAECFDSNTSQQGLEALDTAETALKASLSVRTMKAHPGAWAATSQLLAFVYLWRGVLAPSARSSSFAEAVRLWREAQKVWTSESFPELWANAEFWIANTKCSELQFAGPFLLSEKTVSEVAGIYRRSVRKLEQIGKLERAADIRLDGSTRLSKLLQLPTTPSIQRKIADAIGDLLPGTDDPALNLAGRSQRRHEILEKLKAAGLQ